MELVLVVRLAGRRVALPAASVESVVELEGLTLVPRAALHIAGLAALRSRVLTVVDPYVVLGQPKAAGQADRYEAVVIDLDNHHYALLVDTVEDVVEIKGERLPVRAALGEGWARIGAAMVEADGDLLLLVDVDAVIAGPVAIAA